MRVVYLLRKPVPSSETITLQAVTMAAEMARAGAEVELVVPSLGVAGTDDLLAAYGIPVTDRLSVIELKSWYNPRFNRWRGGGFRRALERLLLAREADQTVVYLRGERGLEVAVDLIDRRTKTHVPVVYEAHKVYRAFHDERHHLDAEKRADKARRAGTIEGRVYEGADGLVAINQALLDEIRTAGGGRALTLVARNGTTPNPDADRVPRLEDVVYAGELAPWKGVGTLVAAFEHLPDRHLRILGGAERKSIEALRGEVLDRGLTDRVSVEGRRPAAAIPALLARTRVVAIPLPGDNSQAARFTSPLKLFQALEAGCAVVASDLPSIREIVRHDRDALLVPPDDARALADGLERVLTDDDLRSRLAAAGRETARSYHWSERARRVLEFLRDVRSGARSAP
jgi:glycosyltransferase involved in cell wall biosynthesis